MTNHRVIGRAEGRLLLSTGLMLVLMAMLATIWPRLVAVPVAVLTLWIGVGLLLRTLRLAHRAPPDEVHATRK